MGERELRHFAKETAGQYAPEGVRGLCRALLDKPPDVVKWAKREQAFLGQAGGDPGDNVSPFDPLSEKGKAWWRGYRQSSADSLSDMQDEFAFRLTDDGWEWTDE